MVGFRYNLVHSLLKEEIGRQVRVDQPLRSARGLGCTSNQPPTEMLPQPRIPLLRAKQEMHEARRNQWSAREQCGELKRGMTTQAMAVWSPSGRMGGWGA